MLGESGGIIGILINHERGFVTLLARFSTHFQLIADYMEEVRNANK